MVRVFCEAFREPDASLLMGMSRGTFYSFFLVLGGLAFIGQAIRRRKSPGT